MKKRAVIYTFLIMVCALSLVVFSGCMASGDANDGGANMNPNYADKDFSENGAEALPDVNVGDEDYGKFIENKL